MGDYLERMWAYRTIERLLETSKYGNVSAAAAKSIQNQALSMCLKVSDVRTFARIL
jgi:hypothetical protein